MNLIIHAEALHLSGKACMGEVELVEGILTRGSVKLTKAAEIRLSRLRKQMRGEDTTEEASLYLELNKNLTQ